METALLPVIFLYYLYMGGLFLGILFPGSLLHHLWGECSCECVFRGSFLQPRETHQDCKVVVSFRSYYTILYIKLNGTILGKGDNFVYC